MEQKQVLETRLPIKNSHIIKLPKDSRILGVRSAIDQHTVLLAYSGYIHNEPVQREITMYFEPPFNAPTTSSFLGVCIVMREKLGYFPGLVPAYIYID